MDRIVSGRFKVRVAVRHSESLVSDHLLGVLECATRHDDVRTERVPIVVEVEVGQVQVFANPFPSGLDVAHTGSIQMADNVVPDHFDTP